MLLCGLLILTLLSKSAMSEPSVQCDNDHPCIAENSWQIGIAIGLGGRTNPLVDADTIPLIIMPDIAYYAESAYFDNGELGWQFTPSSTTSVELFVSPNIEKANFSFWHSANLLAPASVLDSGNIIDGEPAQGPQQDQVSIDDVQSRKWALDAGVRWQWFAQNHRFSVSVAHDVTNVYEGAHASFKYQYLTQLGDWHMSLSPHVTWHSDGLSDYYYGVRVTDTPLSELTYKASGGFQYGFSLYSAYKIDDHWHGLVRARVTRLHSGMIESPLVEDSNVYSAFAGVAYRF